MIIWFTGMSGSGKSTIAENVEKKLSEEGYRIIGCIGDQKSDLEGGYSGHKVKIPNYIYVIE